MFDTPQPDRLQSDFNMAVWYINRLNGLFATCDEAGMTLNASQWFHALMALFRELSTEMKDKEIEEMQGKIKSINEKLKVWIVLYNKRGITEIRPDLYQELHDMEIYLRKVLKKAGLLVKSSDDATRALK